MQLMQMHKHKGNYDSQCAELYDYDVQMKLMIS